MEELILLDNQKNSQPLSINIYTKGDKVHFIVEGFNTPQEAVDWATIQHHSHLMAEKEASTLH